MPMSKKPDSEKKSIQSLWQTLMQIFALSKPYRTRFYAATVVTILASAVWLTVPLGLRELLDAVFESGNNELLNWLAMGLFVLFVLQAAFSFFGNYHLEWVGERVITDLRKKVYEHLHRLGFKFFAERRLGEITSRLTNDVGSIRTALTDSLPQLLTISFSLIGSVSLMVVLNWRLSMVIFVTVPFVTLATRYFGQKIRFLSKDIQDELADSTAVAEDALGAIRLVKAFVREDYEVERYQTAIEKLFKTARRKVVLTQLFWAGVGIMFMSTLVIIFWYGGKEVLADRLTAGDLVAFIIYALNISRSISQTSRLYTAVNTAAGASERIFELLEETPEIENNSNAKSISKVKGEIEVKDLWFSYEGEKDVLRGISFKADAGKTIALVGPSGAGKTTLLNLIPRFYDPQKGVISVDGNNIQDVKFKSLREHISIVPQEVHLFGTSIRENIIYGKLDATEEEIIQAAKDANAHQFIMDTEDGYNSMIGEKGVKLSGGQRQRLAIARAILKNPAILLLDEATSSLDSESEAQVQEALVRLMENRTTFVIAHRLSTVQHADRILVLDEGEIVEQGTHTELIEQGGLYSHLYELQFRDLDEPKVM
ncbi:MAG: ABC transporter ATP-binding protein [Balneola sp.]|jgi:subfamily B ATP-binding cassette protein MsbA|nr:ABC transporter ATP-binding protein [Balneola sp.]MBE80265.1 ABC transporter ATP-binding protein [Balneola sp.]HBX66330.1 ABC transporter ATP-binding protein [Balneolaceae bacterium]|tara:strand:- start:141 stop:1934 length:1794 start_codon:yes stop_codon:yes gene_type:complete